MLFFLFLIFCCKGDSKPERFNHVNHVSSIVLFNQILEAPPGRFWSVLLVGAYKHESLDVSKPSPGVLLAFQQDFRRPKNPWAPQTLMILLTIFCHFRIFLTSTLIPTYHIAMLKVTLCFRYRWVSWIGRPFRQMWARCRMRGVVGG